MRYKTLIIAVLSLLILTLNAEASNNKFKVLLTVVPSSEAGLDSEAKSYTGRELRELQDVEIVEKDPGTDYYLISILPVTLKLTNGVTSGILLSYVIEKNGLIEHNVLIGGPDSLKTLCEKVIAYFDANWLQPQRRRNK
jgi:hypothetical protein